MDDLKFKGMAFLVKTNKPCHIYSIADNLFSSILKEQKETGMSLCVVLDERPFPNEEFLSVTLLNGVEKNVFSHYVSDTTGKNYTGLTNRNIIADTNNIFHEPQTCFRIVFDCDLKKIPNNKEFNQSYDLQGNWVEIFNFYKKFNLSIPQLNGQKFFPVDVVFKDQTLTEISYIKYNLK